MFNDIAAELPKNLKQMEDGKAAQAAGGGMGGMMGGMMGGGAPNGGPAAGGAQPQTGVSGLPEAPAGQNVSAVFSTAIQKLNALLEKKNGEEGGAKPDAGGEGGAEEGESGTEGGGDASAAAEGGEGQATDEMDPVVAAAIAHTSFRPGTRVRVRPHLRCRQSGKYGIVVPPELVDEEYRRTCEQFDPNHHLTYVRLDPYGNKRGESVWMVRTEGGWLVTKGDPGFETDPLEEKLKVGTRIRVSPYVKCREHGRYGTVVDPSEVPGDYVIEINKNDSDYAHVFVRLDSVADTGDETYWGVRLYGGVLSVKGEEEFGEDPAESGAKE